MLSLIFSAKSSSLRFVSRLLLLLLLLSENIPYYGAQLNALAAYVMKNFACRRLILNSLWQYRVEKMS